MLQDFFNGWRFRPVGGANPVDYYATLIGVISASAFCFFLASQIIRSRRRNPVDVTIACVMGLFGIVCIFAIYRLTHDLSYIPYVTASLWILATVLEALASLFLICERRGHPVQMPRFRRRKRT